MKQIQVVLYAKCGFWLFAEMFLFQSGELKNNTGY